MGGRRASEGCSPQGFAPASCPVWLFSLTCMGPLSPCLLFFCPSSVVFNGTGGRHYSYLDKCSKWSREDQLCEGSNCLKHPVPSHLETSLAWLPSASSWIIPSNRLSQRHCQWLWMFMPVTAHLVFLQETLRGWGHSSQEEKHRVQLGMCTDLRGAAGMKKPAQEGKGASKKNG